MSLTRAGGLAAFVCAATYLAGFALLATLLAPTGYGSSGVDPVAVAALIEARPWLLIAWNSTIYILNALALVVLVVALSEMPARSAPGWAAVTRGLGLIWAGLVLAAGMIANVAVERTAQLAASDAAAAAELWATLHAVELGLGGGNEIAGGAWIGGASLAGRIAGGLPRPAVALGVLTGTAGLATLVPPLGDAAGAIFGLGALAWFLAVGAVLARSAAGSRGR